MQDRQIAVFLTGPNGDNHAFGRAVLSERNGEHTALCGLFPRLSLNISS